MKLLCLASRILVDGTSRNSVLPSSGLLPSYRRCLHLYGLLRRQNKLLTRSMLSTLVDITVSSSRLPNRR